jgi:NAD-dependent deacetylase
MTGSQLEIPGELVARLKAAKRVLVLTGAGMSAESGVPTFRDAQTGLWARYRAEELATPEAFHDNPKRVWDWYAERRDGVRDVKPHAGHAALVEMERHFESFVLVTQNVDSLHQRAGSRDVIELHGNIMQSVCSKTGKPIDEGWIAANPGRPPASPHHPLGMARPGVVWFGELLPQAAIGRAMLEAERCDICFSIGTSSLVVPAASLPFMALDAGATVVEINPEPTSLSTQAHYSLQFTAAVALPRIAAALAL